MISPQSTREHAYLAFRVTLGINMLLHGLTRLPKLREFASHITSLFEDTLLPSTVVEGFALGLPFLEATIGILIVLGLLTRWALLAGAWLVGALVFDTALHQDWSTLSSQMIYALVFFVLLMTIESNRKSIDAWRSGQDEKRSKPST